MSSYTLNVTLKADIMARKRANRDGLREVIVLTVLTHHDAPLDALLELLDPLWEELAEMERHMP